MPRFNDRWVVDKTMFEFAMGGSCACCGLASFLPNGTAGVINAMSDLETDAANNEIAALDNSPWPTDMRNQVWADRLRLRLLLKKEMKQIDEFNAEHFKKFKYWCYSQSPRRLRKILQLPRSSITETLGSQYNIHSEHAFAIVLCAVVEQVANFSKTEYKMDGRGVDSGEVEFEENLLFDRRGGFTMDIVHEDDGSLNEAVLEVLLKRFQSLGGPKLLDRNPRTTVHTGDNEGGGDDNVNDDDDEEKNEDGYKKKPEPSFRLDRRIARLLISRIWYDQLKKIYLADVQQSSSSQEKEDSAVSKGATEGDSTEVKN